MPRRPFLFLLKFFFRLLDVDRALVKKPNSSLRYTHLGGTSILVSGDGTKLTGLLTPLFHHRLKYNVFTLNPPFKAFTRIIFLFFLRSRAYASISERLSFFYKASL